MFNCVFQRQRTIQALSQQSSVSNGPQGLRRISKYRLALYGINLRRSMQKKREVDLAWFNTAEQWHYQLSFAQSFVRILK